jgi:hypothetical protein
MITEIAHGAFLRMQVESRPDVFAFLGSTLNIATNVGINRPLETINAFCIDPLTSRMMAGLATFEADEVSEVEVWDRIPVKSDYLIDCVAYFVEFPMAFHSRPTLEWQSAREEINSDAAASFVRHVYQFLVSNKLVVEPIGDSEIWRHNLNVLGLDFMRQHYRSLKNVFLIDRQLPSNAILEYLLRATILNRTDDSDWAFTGSPG